ncbi:unnamed protein product [Clonostachys byssicola]|uniref:Cuticle-degrading protease n=1 Tax=Clonostachys byssicola TaxID=160290 RepID=A0A9N9UKP0_9HYPO|nr:unnamed protein product [Clonostachys byssicola]
MRSSLLLALLPAALCSPTQPSKPAPLLQRRDQTGVLPNKYIVKFKDTSVNTRAESILSTLAVTPEHTFEHVFKGFSGELDQETLEALRNHPDVEYIEEDSIAGIDAYVDQQSPTWGLRRISHKVRGSVPTYRYDDSAGDGTCAYVIDTGIDVTHPDFEGRATFAANFADASDTDGHGHGTHVAGTIGSKTYGVAKKTLLYGVKVIDDDGKGTTSNMIKGLDFVVADAPKRNCPKGVVANMSLRDNVSVALNAAAAALTTNDIFLAVSAGNQSQDASTQSPASEPTVCTIGASGITDQLSIYSNYGAVVDVFAPGDGIDSLAPGGKTVAMSGTSMASPHAAGLAAYFAALHGWPGASALCELLKDYAQNDAVKNIPAGTVNKLIYNGNPDA